MASSSSLSPAIPAAGSESFISQDRTGDSCLSDSSPTAWGDLPFSLTGGETEAQEWQSWDASVAVLGEELTEKQGSRGSPGCEQ